MPPLQLLLWLLLGIIVARAAVMFPQVFDRLTQGDNDDLMRLVRLRDWLGGQGWFDNQQYRVLPPEGISLHWSRYVDLGLAAILVPLGWILPAPMAESALLVLWPTLLLGLLMVLVARGTNRIMGLAAAFGAVIMALTWGKLGGFEFAPGRIDHHNVQMLGVTVALFLSVLPGGRPLLFGALAGLATGVSLAVGLEMVPVLALIWAMAALRQAFDLPQAGRWLVGYVTAVFVSAPLLMAGQMARADWLVAHCDVLATPVLSLLLIGAVATLAPVVLARQIRHPLARIALVGAITGLGLWLAAPLLTPCLAGPYADVSPEARLIIETRITEARSIWSLLQDNPETVLSTLVPLLLVMLGAAAAGLWGRARLSQVQKLALVQMLAVASVGLAVGALQIRAINLAAPAVPFLAGVALWGLLQLPRRSPAQLIAGGLLLIAVPPVTDGLILAARPLHQATGQGGAGGGQAICRSQDTMRVLDAMPPAILFSSMNLGAAILVNTHHNATSAPYHRSNQAYWNGIGAFESEESLRRALTQSHADFLLLCEGGKPAPGYPGQLLAGNLPDWLSPASGEAVPAQGLRVYTVNKAELARAGGSE